MWWTARHRHDSGVDYTYDLLACGLFFNDMGFTGLPPGGPVAGHEVRVGPYQQSPGGIANSSIAASRLGCSVGMVTDAGDDAMSIGSLELLAEEGIDTCHSEIHQGWQTPLTVILNYDGDRAMVTSETAHDGRCVMRADEAPRARVAITHLQPFEMGWLREAADHGTLVLGDVGWDESGGWDLAALPDLGSCHSFTPNLMEARNYTRATDLPTVLERLAEYVPLPVVTLGSDGVAALDAVTGEICQVPAFPGKVVDTGGAGDVLTAAFAAALLTGWALEQRLRFASVVAGITISRLGGATTAPTLSEVQHTVAAMDAADRAPYQFVLDVGARLPCAE